jgi:hypothetical protein
MTLKLLRKPDLASVAVPVSESMNASYNSTAYNLDYLEGFSVVASVVETSASLAGALKLQASNNAFKDNYTNTENPDAIWVDIGGTSVTLTAGSTTVLWNVTQVYYGAFRYVWTRSSGQGTLTPFIVGKGNG